MNHFELKNGELYAENVPMARIAEEVGTPVYVYSRATLERHARVFREALDGLALRGLALHICSQLMSLDPLDRSFCNIGDLLRRLRAAGQTVTHVDLGGGLGRQACPGGRRQLVLAAAGCEGKDCQSHHRSSRA
jgi:diaminopimelate decarboxylase